MNEYIPGDNIPMWMAIPLIIILWLIVVIWIICDRRKAKREIQELDKKLSRVGGSLWIKQGDYWVNTLGDRVEVTEDNQWMQDISASDRFVPEKIE